MHRIDGAGHINHRFVSENPATNRPPTEVTPEILNALQEELATFIEWAGVVLDKGDNTQLQQALIAKFGRTDGVAATNGRNFIINGNFDIWQRNTTFPVATAGENYTADRWLANIGTTGNNSTISRQAFAAGQDIIPNEPAFWLRYAVTAFVGGTPSLEQRIEGVRTLSGKQMTLSFWAKADAARTVSGAFFQAFGSGIAPSATVQTAIGAFNLTNTWKKFTATVTLPSINGKTIGSNGDDCLQLVFALPSGICSIDLAQVQIEAGPSATAFELLPPQQVLALCQRYYEKTFTQGVFPGAVDFKNQVHHDFGVFGTSNGIDCRFKVTKRAAPTVTIYSCGTGIAGYFSTGAADYVADVRWCSDSGFQCYQFGASIGAMGFHYVANAEL